MTNQQAAMARAFGLLETLVNYGHIPALHLSRACDIITQYNTRGDDHDWPAPKTGEIKEAEAFP